MCLCHMVRDYIVWLRVPSIRYQLYQEEDRIPSTPSALEDLPSRPIRSQLEDLQHQSALNFYHGEYTLFVVKLPNQNNNILQIKLEFENFCPPPISNFFGGGGIIGQYKCHRQHRYSVFTADWIKHWSSKYVKGVEKKTSNAWLFHP